MGMAIQEQFCEHCGAANTLTARFCQDCATPLPFRHTTGTLPEQTLLNTRYQLETRIGQGGMGAVYKAIDTKFNNRTIAIKEMSRAGLSPTSIQEAEAAFEREAQILGELLHPNLPRIYDHFTDGERSYLVMDFIEGQTLEDFTEKAHGKPQELDRVLPWGTQLCDVLSYLHTRQPPIIFRDLKPSNVMIDGRGHIYLIDFGIARIFKPGQSHDTVALGSPGFAAPEQYGKSQSTPRSDIYSLGALLHCLLTGVDPSEQPFFFKPASQLNSEVPSSLEHLLQRMLEMDAEKRPFTAQEVLQLLRQIDQQRISGTLNLSQPMPSLSGLTPPPPHAHSSPMPRGNPILQDAYRLYTQRRLPEALALYDRAVKTTDSTNPIAWQGLGLTQAHRGQHVDALRSFDHALRLDSTLVTALNGRGAALNIIGRNQDALEAFDRAILQEKDNVIAWNGKGAALSALGQPEMALAAIDAALHFDPEMAPACGNKGLVLRQLRRYPEAIKAFDKALNMTAPNDLAAQKKYWNGKGLVFYEMGRFNEAMSAYQQALKLDGHFAPALCGVGDVLYAQQKFKGALDHYERAIASDRRLAKAWEKRGMLLSDMDRPTRALESYDEALRLDPHYAAAWNGKASILCTLQRYEDALLAYDRALAIQPNAAHAWNGKGNAYYHLESYEMALDAYDRALRLYPRMVTALHNKSLVLKHLERYDEALDAAENAILLAPHDPDNWLRKAEALRKMRRRREARAAETEAERLRGSI